jgi:mRNA-degrading endonuclease toxin of MazEF toxin-antitoxin module
VPIKQGEILWATCTDPQGANEKRRPVVVVTRSEEIERGEPIIAAAITTTLPEPLTDEFVELPWHRDGSARTGLRKRCAVYCRWLMELNPDDVEKSQGHVPGGKLKEIIERLNRIHGWSAGDLPG